MKIFFRRGIFVKDVCGTVVLDPRRRAVHGVVSHAHLDHLMKGSLMTPATRDVMQVRTGSSEAETLDLDVESNYGGFDLTLREAGHVLGSAMVHLRGPTTDLLYTGDLNPRGGETCAPARPEECDVLVIEATYGGHDLPPKEVVVRDMLSWIRMEAGAGPVAIGAYEFGKAQEIIATLNKAGIPVYTSGKIADLCEVYRMHGVGLRYEILEKGSVPEEDHVAVLPSGMVRPPFKDLMNEYRNKGARTAYVSGWCTVFDYTRKHGLDAQFPISDHGDRQALLDFVKACSPGKVYTVYGATKELAHEITERLGIDAEPLL